MGAAGAPGAAGTGQSCGHQRHRCRRHHRADPRFCRSFFRRFTSAARSRDIMPKRKVRRLESAAGPASVPTRGEEPSGGRSAKRALGAEGACRFPAAAPEPADCCRARVFRCLLQAPSTPPRRSLRRRRPLFTFPAPRGAASPPSPGVRSLSQLRPPLLLPPPPGRSAAAAAASPLAPGGRSFLLANSGSRRRGGSAGEGAAPTRGGRIPPPPPAVPG